MHFNFSHHTVDRLTISRSDGFAHWQCDDRVANGSDALLEPGDENFVHKIYFVTHYMQIRSHSVRNDVLITRNTFIE